MFDLLTAALLIVIAVRAIRRLRGGLGGPIPDVPNAPDGAEPLAAVRYDDNGLATYTWVWKRRPRIASDPGSGDSDAGQRAHD